MRTFILILFWVSAAHAVTNSLTITEKAGTTTANYPVQIGRPFASGEISQYPQAILDGTPVSTQADVKTRWPNGSVKHAILTFYIPTLTANSTVTVTFQNQATGQNAGYLVKADMLDAAYDFGATMDLTNGSTVSANARTMVNADAFTYWLQGVKATSIIVVDHSATRAYDIGFDAYRAFRPIFHATFFPVTHQVRVRFIGEIASTVAIEDQAYSLVLKTGNAAPATVYTQASFTHTGNSRWTKEFWIGGTPSTISINHNLAYLASTTLLPNYDTSRTPSEATIASQYSVWTAAAKGIQDAGNWYKTMPDQGGRPDIGPYPAWTVRWLYTGDYRMREQAFGNADLAASWPMHFREGDGTRYIDRALTIPGIGHVISVSSRPRFCLYSWPNSCGGDDVTRVGTTTNNGWGQDRAHQPDPFSAQYLLSGDYWYLEELWFWAAWDTAVQQNDATAPWGRGPTGVEGNIYDEIRGQAWLLRTRARAAAYAPDDAPEKGYFTQHIADVIASWDGQHAITSSPYYGNAMWTWAHNMVTTGTWAWTASPPETDTLHFWSRGDPTKLEGQNPAIVYGGQSGWEQNFMLYALGNAAELGFTASHLAAYLSGNIIGQLTDPGYVPYMICNYRMPVTRASDGGFFQDWASVKTGFLTQDSATWQSTCTSQLTDPEHGYAVISIAAAAVAASQTSGDTAWSWVATNFLTASALNENPKWAILPRATAPARLTAPWLLR